MTSSKAGVLSEFLPTEQGRIKGKSRQALGACANRTRIVHSRATASATNSYSHSYSGSGPNGWFYPTISVSILILFCLFQRFDSDCDRLVAASTEHTSPLAPNKLASAGPGRPSQSNCSQLEQRQTTQHPPREANWLTMVRQSARARFRVGS